MTVRLHAHAFAISSYHIAEVAAKLNHQHFTLDQDRLTKILDAADGIVEVAETGEDLSPGALAHLSEEEEAMVVQRPVRRTDVASGFFGSSINGTASNSLF